MHVIRIKFFILLTILTFSKIAISAEALTYHGRILNPSGTAVSGSVSFQITIKSPGTESCIVYQETQSQSLTGGIFSLKVGTGTRPGATVDGNFTLEQALANRGTLDLGAAGAVSACASGTTYTPASTDMRKIILQFNDGSGWQNVPVQDLTFSPMAIESRQVGGYTAPQLLRVDSSTATTNTEFNSADFAKLLALIAGTSSLYTKANELGGYALPGGMTSGDAIKWNGSGWSKYSTSSGSGITSLGGQTGATQTFAIGTSGTAPAFSSATNTHTLNIPMASTASVTAGLISKSDYDNFNTKLGTGTSFSGDVSGAYNSTSVDKIKGTAVTIISLTSGNFLKYNGTAWVNSNIANTDVSGLGSLATKNSVDLSSSDATGTLAAARFPALTGDVTNTAGSLSTTIANNAITSAKILDGTIAPADLNFAGSMAVNTGIVVRDDSGNFFKKSCAGNEVLSWSVSNGWICTSVSSLVSGSYLAVGGNATGSTLIAGTTDNNNFELRANNNRVATIQPDGTFTVGANGPGSTYTTSINQADIYLRKPSAFAELTNASTSGSLRFRTTNSSNSTNYAMAINQDGYVLLGDAETHFDTIYDLSFQKSANISIGVERNYYGNDGKNLTINAGGAKSASTNQVGGDLVLSSGVATGSGSSNISFQTAAAGASGTADRTPATRMTILGNGNVGIGTTNPGKGLEVSNGSDFIQVDPNNAGIWMVNGSNTQGGWGILQGWHDYNDLTILQNGSNQRMTLTYDGKAGFGTADPATKLEVTGAVKIGNDATACSATLAGAMRYNASNIQFCNGSSWQSFGVAGAGITTLGGQTGSTQTFAIGTSGTAPAFSSATNTHTLNIPMASTASVTAGLLSKSDYDAFNTKLGTSTSFSGDVSGNYNSTSVDKIKGTALSITSLTSGNFLKYNGTNWVNSNIANTDVSGLGSLATKNSVDLSSSDATGTLAAARFPALTGDVTNTAGSLATTIANNAITSAKILDGTIAPADLNFAGSMAVNTGIVVRDDSGNFFKKTCAGNEVLAWNVSNGWSCSSISSLTGTGYIVNGGNSIATAITIGTNDNNNFAFRTNNTVKMTLDTSGNLGINTAYPSAHLHVVNGAGSTVPTDTNAVGYFSTDTNAANMYLAIPNSFSSGTDASYSIASGGVIKGGLRYSVAGDYIAIHNANAVGSEPFIVKAGAVGIGTTSPSAGLHNNKNAAASTPIELLSGTWYTAGTATTNKPQLLVEPTSTTSTGWSTAGTGFGVNAASGFVGNLVDLQLNGTSKFKVDYTGKITGDGSGLTNILSGSGTNGKITRFTASSTIGDSIMTESTGKIAVNGQIVSAGTTNQTSNSPNINFNNGNSLYVTSACTAFTLSNMADGGSYQLNVQNTSGTCSFTSSGDTVHYAGGVSNVTITAHTIFSFAKLGTQVYVTWVSF